MKKGRIDQLEAMGSRFSLKQACGLHGHGGGMTGFLQGRFALQEGPACFPEGTAFPGLNLDSSWAQ